MSLYEYASLAWLVAVLAWLLVLARMQRREEIADTDDCDRFDVGGGWWLVIGATPGKMGKVRRRGGV
jgi:hypothetical protein